MPSWLYFLLDGDIIVYIGHTENLSGRVKCHTKTKTFTSVMAYKTRTFMGKQAERFLIGIYRPKYNRLHGYRKSKVKFIPNLQLP